MSIEEQLKNLILGKFKSVRAFTQSLNIPYSTVDTMLKRGIGGTSITTVLKVCYALDIDVESLDTDIIRLKTYTGTIKNESKIISDEAIDVAQAYEQAEFKDKNMARYALGLPLKKEDEPSKSNSTHIPDIKKITQEALEFKKAMSKAQLKK